MHFKMVDYLDNSGAKKESMKYRGKDKSGKSFCWRKFTEFCKRTDLHGYKYIVMEDLSTTERICWALAVALSIVCTAFFVVTAYKWYARNPIVTVIESTQGAIWDVPFPAVTICDLNVVSRRAARAFTNNLTLPSNISREFIFDTVKLAPLLHSSYMADLDQKQRLHQLQVVLDLNNISIESLFKSLSPAASCSQLVEKCMWKNTIYRCDELFQQIFTVINLCCTFNYYAVDTTDRSDTEGNEWLHMSTPRRVTSCGYQTALTVLLHTDPDDYYSATVASQGALVFIDNAYNIPDLDSPARMVNPSTEVLIALSPERTYTTSGVKAFIPEQRQCYYNDEIKIGDFRQYSFHNCMAYQKTLIIKNACDCVPFFFPSNEYHRTCNFKDLDCLENIINPDHQRHDSAKTNIDSFQCLPECEHYEYPLEVALGKLASNIKSNELPFFNDVNLENRSLLNVFFNDLVSTRYRRDVYLNWQNILAAFGGLLSLMLGFTLISGFDMILFLVLCWGFTTKKYTNNKTKSRGTHKKEAWGEISTKQRNLNDLKRWEQQHHNSHRRY